MEKRPVLLRFLVIVLIIALPFACRRPAAKTPDSTQDTPTVVPIGRDESDLPEVVEPEPEPEPEPPKDSDAIAAAQDRTYPDGKSWSTDYPDGKSWTPTQPPTTVRVPEEAPPEETREPLVAREPELEPSPVPEIEPAPGPEPEPEPEPESAVVETPEPEPEAVVQPETGPEVPEESIEIARAQPEAPTPEISLGPPGPVPVDTTGTAPVIEVTSPLERTFYTSEVIVEGFIRNSPDSSDSDQIEEFSYDVPSAPGISGAIYHNEADGEFWFSFLSSDLQGVHTLEIKAKNADGAERVATIQLHDGNLKPVVQLERPSAKQGYGTRLLVSGRAYDPSDDLGQPREVEAVEYEVYPSGTFSARDRVSGTFQVSADGSFSGVISTRTFSDDIDVIVRAQTSGGKNGETTLTLARAEGDIPSFRAEAGDREVSLEWTELPDTLRYDVFYAPDTAEAEWTELSDVTSPTVIPGLENEHRYRFQLRSTLPGDENEISAIRRNVPLEPDGIVLQSSDEYRRVALSWNRISGSESYRVVRADLGPTRQGLQLPPDDSDAWRTVAVVSDQDYNDIGVELGVSYAYRVGPNYPDSVLSAVRVGRTTVMPAYPARTSSELETGSIRELGATGSYAVYTDANGIHLVDISTPELPVAVSNLAIDNTGGLAVAGDVAVVTSSEGANFISLRDKRSPRLDSRWSLPGADEVVFVNAGPEQVLALAAGGRGVTVLDAAGTTAQTQLAVIDTPDATALTSDGRFLFIGRASGFAGYDLTTPGTPRLVGSQDGPRTTSMDFDLSNGLLAVGTEQNVQLYRVESDGTFRAAASIQYPAGAVTLLEAADRIYLISAHQDGVRVTDVTDPYVARDFAYDSDVHPGSLVPVETFSGETIVLAGENTGLKILDLFVVGQSRTIATAVTGGGATAVDLVRVRDRTVALVADGAAGVAGYPTDPDSLEDSQPILRLPTEYAIRAFIDPSDESRVFVADGRAGVRSFQVSETDAGYSATELLSFPTDGTLWDMAIVHRLVDGAGRTLAYLANGDGGFVVADVTERDLVRQIGSVVLRDVRSVLSLDNLGVQGGSRFALVADEQRGLLLIDVTDPVLPSIIDEREISGARQVTAFSKDGSSYVAVLGNEGVSIFEFSAGFGPLIGHYDTRFGERFAVSGDLMVLAEGFRGLSVVDISDPTQPTLIGNSDLEYAADVAVSDSTLYAVDNEALHALELLIPPWLIRNR